MKINKVTKIGILGIICFGLNMSFGENFCPNCGFRLKESLKKDCRIYCDKKCRSYWLKMKQEGRFGAPKFCKGNEVYRNCKKSGCDFKQDKRCWKDSKCSSESNEK